MIMSGVPDGFEAALVPAAARMMKAASANADIPVAGLVVLTCRRALNCAGTLAVAISLP